MAEPQLSVRSAKARDLREAGREPASSFYASLSQQSGADIDLEAVLTEGRQAHEGVEL